MYEDWKIRSLSDTASDAQMRTHAEQLRSRVASRPDPFGPLIADTALREQKGERVLWENDEIFVLVDRGGRKALVIPKRLINYIIDAPSVLATHLAEVAAVTSDAFINAAGDSCSESAQSKIWINPPTVVGVGRLHVHVEPPGLGPAASQDDFYARATTYLVAALK